MHTTSNEVAASLGVSQRHARRLIAAGDYRLEPIDTAAMQRMSRQRIAGECVRHAAAVCTQADALSVLPACETYNEGPHIDRVRALAKRLRRLAGELRTLASELLDGTL